MGESAFQAWWELHVRVARGESLTSDDHAIYQAGQQDLESGEECQLLLGAKQARDELAVLESERSKLERRHQELDAEIQLLESRMGQQTRRLLGVEN